jgi:hypothetical protein
MFNPAKFLDELIHFDPQQRLDEAYLAQASDLGDLERRMLELETQSHQHVPAGYSLLDTFAGHARQRG